MTEPLVRPPVVHLAPQAGADTPARALFLDRDGVINVDHGYVHAPAATDWVPGIFDLVRAANASGLLTIVVTNQAGIARGLYSEDQFIAYTQWMHAEFAARDAPLHATYYCPHHPEAGRGRYRCACPCRKPAPGLLLAASRDYGIDLPGSRLIGDKQSDIMAAEAAGIRDALLVGKDARVPIGWP